MRWSSHEDMDIFETPRRPIHSDRLRELVDSLPVAQRHLIERVYFGALPGGVERASREVGLSAKQGKVQLGAALETIRQAVLEEDELEWLFADCLGRELDRSLPEP